MTKRDIITLSIAAYGAVISTVVLLRQIFSDRVRVKLTVRKNAQIVGDPRYQGQTLVIFRVTNVGHRPVTIKSFGGIGLHPHLSFSAYETHPQLPCEITDGEYIEARWNRADISLPTIDYWEARDTHGKVHRLQEASWFKHWKSEFLLRRSVRKRKKGHNATPPAI